MHCLTFLGFQFMGLLLYNNLITLYNNSLDCLQFWNKEKNQTSLIHKLPTAGSCLLMKRFLNIPSFHLYQLASDADIIDRELQPTISLEIESTKTFDLWELKLREKLQGMF